MQLHVFLVHSYITFNVSLSIIDKKKLDEKDILFITERDFEVHQYPSVRNITFDFTGLFQIKSHKRYIIEYDSFINSITNGRPFVAFIPHSYQPSFKLITSHSNCIKYNYIEEGLLSYYTSEMIDRRFFNAKRGSLKNKVENLCYKFIGQNRMVFYDTIFDLKNVKYNLSYTLFEGGFISHNNVIKLPFTQQTIASTKEEIGSLFIMGIDVEANLVSEKDFLGVLRTFLLYFSKTRKSIFVKFHPSQSEVLKNKMIHLFSEYLEIEVLGKDFNIEAYSIQQHNTVFYHFLSSAGFYAKLNGNEVYSLLGLIDESKIKLNLTLDLPPKYLEVMKNLKLN